MRVKLFYIILLLVLFCFFIVSNFIFHKVFSTADFVIDEEFHLQQGLEYCNFQFDSWNPKITTLPGLYLISATALGPFDLCSRNWLRFVNLLASVLNFILLYICFGLYTHKQVSYSNLIAALNVSLLPPLYFFAHLYYTDVISVTFVLLLAICYEKNNHVVVSICGVASFIMRQTNICWLLMTAGDYGLCEALKHAKLMKKRHEKFGCNLTEKEVCKAAWELRDLSFLKRFTLNTWTNLAAYLAPLISFALFVYLNGSIVVGDKKAHTAGFHLPQLFYFTLFCLFFAWPFCVSNIKPFVKDIYKYKFITAAVLLGMLMVVYLNTVEHPYLLADNRHYTFYVWKNFYKRYIWFRYAIIPVYLFGLHSIYHKVVRKGPVFALMYICCTLLTLVPQKMIEIRYFLIPYIFYRLNCGNASKWQLAAEFVWNCAVNAAVFYIFFTKAIYWKDFDFPQRLIW